MAVHKKVLFAKFIVFIQVILKLLIILLFNFVHFRIGIILVITLYVCLRNK